MPSSMQQTNHDALTEPTSVERLAGRSARSARACETAYESKHTHATREPNSYMYSARPHNTRATCTLPETLVNTETDAACSSELRRSSSSPLKRLTFCEIRVYATYVAVSRSIHGQAIVFVNRASTVPVFDVFA